MQMERQERTVREIVDLHREGMLRANPEYQRGAVWTSIQKKKLIDSIMRGYPLPLIYLHHIRKEVSGMKSEVLEIIDGQQRINALFGFAEGAFTLLDPAKGATSNFPNFLKSQPCPWANKDIHSLNEEMKSVFFDTPLSIAWIETEVANEVRDLFIRLQSGLPLNAQETRDAWPGQFTDFILRWGGKPIVDRYPGHQFFSKVMGMKPARDRGKTRQLCAQIAMLYFDRRGNSYDRFSDINSTSIDNFYYSHIDFDQNSSDARRFIAILDKLTDLLSDGARPKLRGHDVIHLFLLVDSLWDDYTRKWEEVLPSALDKFLEALVNAKATRDSEHPDEFWLRYGQWTRVNSDRGDRIERRHEFYVNKMLEYLQPLQPKDSKRLFGPLEREVIYFRDQKKCAVCEGKVLWQDAEIHHLKEHARGGATIMENGVLVHSLCHPKGAAAISFRWHRGGRETREDAPVTPSRTGSRQDHAGQFQLGQGATLNIGEEIYLFLFEDEKRDNSPAATAEVRTDGIYLFGSKVESSKGSVIQPAMKIVQRKVNHRNQQGELISLSAWRQWHVIRDGKLVRLLDIKDPSQARRRRHHAT